MGAQVVIIMGSRSDIPVMKEAAIMLDSFGISYEMRAISAHRAPADMVAFIEGAEKSGTKVVIAGAGGAAHLPGMCAAVCTLPVIGVPVETKSLGGLDSLLSIVQMPGGVPVATVAIGTAGAKNAGILAAQIIAHTDSAVKEKLIAFKKEQTVKVMSTSVIEKEW